MISIETRYLPATDTKPYRIVAETCNGHRIVIGQPVELSGEEAHRCAAELLCKKMNWSTELIGAGTKSGFVFVWPAGHPCNLKRTNNE